MKPVLFNKTVKYTPFSNLSLTFISMLKIKSVAHDLITTSWGPTRIHDSKNSTNSETVIQWVSIKYNPASKSHSSVKVITNYRL